MIEWVPLLSGIVGLGYVVFSILIVIVLGGELVRWLLPQRSIIKFLAIISMTFTAIFLIFCGEHHIHTAIHIYLDPDSFPKEWLYHMFWEELMQAAGVWGPIPLIFIIRAILKNLRKGNAAKIG